MPTPYYILGPYPGSPHFEALQAGAPIPDKWYVPAYIYTSIDDALASYPADYSRTFVLVHRVGDKVDDRGRILLRTVCIVATRTVEDGVSALEILPLPAQIRETT